jgi:hypothetical protein
VRGGWLKIAFLFFFVALLFSVFAWNSSGVTNVPDPATVRGSQFHSEVQI